MSKLFNSLTETSLRMILLLDTVPAPVTIDKASFLDLASIYSYDFGIGLQNLHGDGTYSFAEYTAKRSLISEAMKYIVSLGFAELITSQNGFSYGISEKGKKAASSLSGEYCRKYKEFLKLSINSFFCLKDANILSILNEKASEIIPRRYDEQFLH